jgi:hypothetical protein
MARGLTTKDLETASERSASPVVWIMALAIFVAVVGFGLYGPQASASLHAQLMSVVQSAPGLGRYYPDCAAAHAAGVNSIRRDEPGYRAALDPNGDGFACTPFEYRRVAPAAH